MVSKEYKNSYNDYLRYRILKDIAIGERFTFGYVTDIARIYGRTNRNTANRILRTLIEYGYIERISDGIYRKLSDFSTKEIEYIWLPEHPEKAIKRVKINGIVTVVALVDTNDLD